METTLKLTESQLSIVIFSVIDEKNAYRETLSKLEPGTPEFENIQQYIDSVIALEDSIQAQINAQNR